MGIGIKISVLIGLIMHLFSLNCYAQDKDMEELFQKLVYSYDDEYVIARESFLNLNNVEPYLNVVLKSSEDWKEKITARAMLGWLRKPTLYKELWDWPA